MPTSALLDALFVCFMQRKHLEPVVYRIDFPETSKSPTFGVVSGIARLQSYLDTFKVPGELLKLVTRDYQQSEFREWLQNLRTTHERSMVKLESLPEGTIVFPNTPILQLMAPRGMVMLMQNHLRQLLEASMSRATHALQYREKCPPEFQLWEDTQPFVSSSEEGLDLSYQASMVGFQGTTNLEAVAQWEVPTLSHMSLDFLVSAQSWDPPTGDYPLGTPARGGASGLTFWERLLKERTDRGWTETSEDELKAFAHWAMIHPKGSYFLVSSQHSQRSGLRNLVLVAKALQFYGHAPGGVILDRGDLAYESQQAREFLSAELPEMTLGIMGSSTMDLKVVSSLMGQEHALTGLLVGEDLTRPPPLHLRGSFSCDLMRRTDLIYHHEDSTRIPVPGRMQVYRVVDGTGTQRIDVLTLMNDDQVGGEFDETEEAKEIICQHPYQSRLRCIIRGQVVMKSEFPKKGDETKKDDEVKDDAETGKKPFQMFPLMETRWDPEQADGRPRLAELRRMTQESLAMIRADHRRSLNPTPGKVSLEKKLSDRFHALMEASRLIPSIE